MRPKGAARRPGPLPPGRRAQRGGPLAPTLTVIPVRQSAPVAPAATAPNDASPTRNARSIPGKSEATPRRGKACATRWGTQLASPVLARAASAAVWLCAAAASADVGWTLPADLLSTLAGTDHAVVNVAYEPRVAAEPIGAGPIAAGPIAASVADDAIRRRLDRLEADNARLTAAQARLADSLEGFANSGHSGATMRINGRIHFDLWAFPGTSPGVNGFETGDVEGTPQDQVGFRRVRIGFVGDLSPNMLYNFEIEMAGAEESQFRDVYLGWRDLPLLQTVLVGNQKRPYGLDHLNSSRFNVFLERPLVVEAFNIDARRLGIQSVGVSENLAWNWRWGVFNQRLIQDEGVYIGDHWQSQIAGRIANTAWHDGHSGGRGYLHWALAGTWANTDGDADNENFAGSGVNEARFSTRPEARSVRRWLDTGVIAGAESYTLLATEAVLNLGPLQLVAEQQNVFVERSSADRLYLHGGYAYASYFLTGEHIPWNRELGVIGRVIPREDFFLFNTRRGVCGGLGAWQLALRWSYADFADGDLLGGDGRSLTFGANWYWNPYAKLQLNYLYGEIKDNDLNAPAGAPTFGDYHALGTRFVIDF